MTQKEARGQWLQLRAFEIAVDEVRPPLATANLKISEQEVYEKGVRNAILRINTWILARRHPSTTHFKRVEFDIPATWFQHLKESAAPKWQLKWSPVKYATLRETVTWQSGNTYLCPHINNNLDKDHLKFLLDAEEK